MVICCEIMSCNLQMMKFKLVKMCFKNQSLNRNILLSLFVFNFTSNIELKKRFAVKSAKSQLAILMQYVGKSNLSLYSLYYAKACNEFVGPISESLRPTTQLLSKNRRNGSEPLAILCQV